jgi:hypothetical protein
MNARIVFRERKRMMEGINRNLLARPPLDIDKDDPQVISLFSSFIIYFICCAFWL